MNVGNSSKLFRHLQLGHIEIYIQAGQSKVKIMLIVNNLIVSSQIQSWQEAIRAGDLLVVGESCYPVLC